MEESVKAEARRRSEEEAGNEEASKTSVQRCLVFIHAAAAKVQGAVVAEVEEIVGLRRGTALTRA